MSRVVTLRISPALVARADARAAELGLDRGKYVRSLIEQDLAQKSRRKHRFASEDFIGSTSLGRGPYTNKAVRDLVRERLVSKREKSR